MLQKLPDSDDRVQPMAYITDGVSLYEVISRRGTEILLENCRSFVQFTAKSIALAKYRLIKAAPRTIPETVDSP